MRALLSSLLSVLVVSCGSNGWNRDPTPGYLAVRPQTVQVVEVWGARDDVDEIVRSELVAHLGKLGYRVVGPGEPADADVRFWVSNLEYGRDWYDGIASAEMVVQVEVRSASGVIYKDQSRGWRGETEFDEEFEEDNDRHGTYEIVMGAVLDDAVDAVVPVDYDEMLKDAARSAARGALSHLPERMAPLPASEPATGAPRAP